MFKQKGLKLSWYLGWLGTFSWLYGFTVYFFVIRLYVAGVIGLVLSILSILFITLISPWKFPNTKYLYLFLPPLINIILSAIWLIYFLQPITKENISILWFSWIILTFLPIIQIGKKTWNDYNTN